jgi:hypothetical protein
METFGVIYLASVSSSQPGDLCQLYRGLLGTLAFKLYWRGSSSSSGRIIGVGPLRWGKGAGVMGGIKRLQHNTGKSTAI